MSKGPIIGLLQFDNLKVIKIMIRLQIWQRKMNMFIFHYNFDHSVGNWIQAKLQL